MLAQKLSLRSCRTDVADPPGLAPLNSIKPLADFNFTEVVGRRKTTLEKWRMLLTHLPQ
jgi:hypothetical protein